jgi:hypothetical protein
MLMDPSGEHVSHVSAVTEKGGKLFLGNLGKDYVSVLDLQVVQWPVAGQSSAA